MFGSFSNYLSAISRAWSSQNGQAVSELVSLQDKHIMNRNLYVKSPNSIESSVERQLEQPIDEIVSSHLKVLYHLSPENRNISEAYKNQAQCVQGVVRMLQALKDSNWCLPIMYVVCLDLRILAQRCEVEGQNSKPGEILENAAECLMGCFRVCVADNRSSEEDTKRLGMLNLVNQMLKVYFRLNKLNLCQPLIRAIDSSPLKEAFPLTEQITYKYFVGRKAIFDSDYKTAEECLSFAFRHCKREFRKNKRLILIYLAPVKMLLGYMPKKDVLERYDVLQFHELATALKMGNVRQFDEIVQKHESFFINCGIYLLVEKLIFIAYRNLFKKVYLIVNDHRIDLSSFQKALEFVGETNISLDETHCIVANLISDNKIKGYISHVHNKVVVSRQNAFPPLHSKPSAVK